MGAALADSAAKADAAADSFDRLATTIGQDADEMLTAMQQASRGMVSDAELVIAANRLLASEAITSGQQVSQLLQIAHASARAMGLSTNDAFGRLVDGLTKAETELLDELGITIRLNEVFDQYAANLGKSADELTDLQRKQAVYAAIVKESQPILEAQGEETESQKDRYEQLATAAQNYFNVVGKGIGVVGEETGVVEGVTGALNAQVGILGTLINLFTSYVDWVAKGAKAFEDWQRATGNYTGWPGQPGTGGSPMAPSQVAPQVPSWMTSVPPSASAPLLSEEEGQRVAERRAVMEEWAANVIELERNTANERLDAIRDHGKRRQDMIEDYEKNLTRSAPDYAKQRARAVEDYEKGVARLQRDAQAQQLRMAEDHERNLARMREDHARRLGDLQEDLDTRIGERRAESAERIADAASDRDEGIVEARQASADRLLEIEEDYSRDRARAIRQHDDTLNEAASRLDARAIFNEQRRFAREQDEAEESHQEKVDDEQEKLDEAIKNLNEAYAEKVADEQAALQKSIDQAQIAYDKQVADANAALRPARAGCYRFLYAPGHGFSDAA